MNLPYEVEINVFEASDFFIKSSAGAGATVKCGSQLNCNLTAKLLALSVVSAAAPPPLAAEGISLSRSGGLLPEHRDLDG